MQTVLDPSAMAVQPESMEAQKQIMALEDSARIDRKSDSPIINEEHLPCNQDSVTYRF